MLEGTLTRIPDDSNFRIVVKTPDGMPSTLKGVELLTATCRCGASYNIILRAVKLQRAGIVAYTVIQLDGAEEELTDTLDSMRRHRSEPADIDKWIVETLADEFNDAVRIVNEKGVMLVEEDWTESKYSTGWVEED